jgi:hypothetical protein
MRQTMAQPRCKHTILDLSCEACKALRDKWYTKLAASGFEDQEELDSPKNLLKSKFLSGDVSLSPREDEDKDMGPLDFEMVQEPEEPLVSISPQNLFRDEDSFFYSEDFKDVCEGLQSKVLTSNQIKNIWQRHIEGATVRGMAKEFKTSKTVVHRVIQQLKARMELMKVEEEIVIPPTKVVLRAYKPQVDEPFLYASWRNSLWYDEDRTENPDKFFRLSTKTIRKILSEEGTVVKVAVEDSNPLFILGYAVYSNSKMLWAYVKADYRNQGIATLLCKDAKSYGQPMTKIGKAIGKNKGLKYE